MNKEYIKHKLTAYHWRHNRKDLSILGICSCGWRDKVFRTGLKGHARRLKCTFGHRWGATEPIELGAVYEEDGEWKSEVDDPEVDTVIGYTRQCERCYKCIDVAPGRS